MVDKKISELPEAATLTGLEELPAVQGPDTVRVSIQEIANLVSTPTVEFVGVRAYHNTTQSVPAGPGDVVLFNSEEFDSHGFHSIVSQTDRFTVPTGKGGYYALHASICFAVSGTNQRTVFLRKNGVSVKGSTTEIGVIPNGAGLTIQTSAVVYLEAGDYVDVAVYHGSGAALDIGFTEPRNHNSFSMTLIGGAQISPTLAGLSDVDFVPAPTNSQVLTYNSTTSKWEPRTKLFEVMSSQFGTVESNAILANLMPGVNLSLPENLSGSAAFSEVAATSSTVFSLRKNGTEVATITFGASQSTGTLSTQAAVSFLSTDKITLVAPTTPDATLASVAFRIQFLEV